MIRKMLVVAALVGAFFAFAGSAANAQDCGYGGCPTTTTTKPGGGGSTTTTKPSDIPTVTAVRGETITVTGRACAPNATVTVTWDDGTVLGTCVGVDNYGAGDVLDIERPDGKRFMVPMRAEAVPEWDASRLVIDALYAE